LVPIFFVIIFAAPYANKETYKANKETAPCRGRCLIVLYAKIIKAFPDLGRLLIF
jgi:hypothetical protein